MNLQRGLARRLADGLEERVHVLELLREGDAQLAEQRLVVVEDLAGLAERQRGLLAAVVHGSGHAVIEVGEVDLVRERLDVGIEILDHVVLGVAGQARDVDDAQRGHAHAGSVGAGQLSVDVIVAADVLGLHGDVRILGLERLDLPEQRLLVGTGEGMPEHDFRGLIRRDGRVDFSQRGAGKQHQRSQEQCDEILHGNISFSFFRLVAVGSGTKISIRHLTFCPMSVLNYTRIPSICQLFLFNLGHFD